MAHLKAIGICAIAAALYGCGDLTDEATSTETSSVTTPGGQTKVPNYPTPNPSGLGYLEYLPAGYATGTSFPLVVFFHGNGEKGDGSLSGLDKVLAHGPPEMIEEGTDFPAIVISPQLPSGSWEDTLTVPFVDYLVDHYKVDPSRIYVTGLSLGGWGTLMYARKTYSQSLPNVPAAIVTVCAYKDASNYGALAGLPLWVFHGEWDSVVPIGKAVSLLTEITGVSPSPVVPGSTDYFHGASWSWRTGQAAPAAGENPTFTVYNDKGHDIWDPAYDNQAMWTWLFAQRRGTTPPPPPPADVVFQQDFQSSTSLAAYETATAPTSGQFNDIGGQASSGTFSISSAGGQNRLQLARTGSTIDNNAAISRWTDPAGPTSVLHVAFDLGVSGWTTTPFQSNAMVLSFVKMSGLVPYENGDVAAATFHRLSVKGKGTGGFAVETSGLESAVLPTNGSLHHIEVFLNKSGAAQSYRAPTGSLQTLQNNGVALWVNGAAVVANGAALNGVDSTLGDFRIAWAFADNGTWQLDNLVMKRGFPQ